MQFSFLIKYVDLQGSVTKKDACTLSGKTTVNDVTTQVQDSMKNYLYFFQVFQDFSVTWSASSWTSKVCKILVFPGV